VRHIVLSEDGIHVAPNAFHRLLATCFFPENTRDQQQALLIAEIEKQEFLRVGAANYQPSEIVLAVSQMIERRTAQLYCAGFVGVSYVWLQMNGFRPSLNRASIIASHAILEFGKVTWRPSLNPSAKERTKPVTGDAATVERIFRKYRSVAHICAARVSAASYLEETHVWDQVPDVVAAMIHTSRAFQVALEKATDTGPWNLWDVKKYFPAELAEAPLLAPDVDLLYWVERGYALAVESGIS
jgi:hypothetical protein